MTKLYQFVIQLREEEAKRRGVPPYLIFETGVLEKLARIRPTSEEAFRGKGVERGKGGENEERLLVFLAHFSFL